MKIFFKTPGGWQFLWERKPLEMDKFRLRHSSGDDRGGIFRDTHRRSNMEVMSMRNSRKPPQVRDFRCEVCGEKVQATKSPSRKTSAGHIKHMWCIKCKEETPHVQISRNK